MQAYKTLNIEKNINNCAKTIIKHFTEEAKEWIREQLIDGAVTVFKDRLYKRLEAMYEEAKERMREQFEVRSSATKQKSMSNTYGNLAEQLFESGGPNIGKGFNIKQHGGAVSVDKVVLAINSIIQNVQKLLNIMKELTEIDNINKLL